MQITGEYALLMTHCFQGILLNNQLPIITINMFLYIYCILVTVSSTTPCIDTTGLDATENTAGKN